MEAQIENKADSPSHPMNDRETARHDIFHCTIARRRPGRDTPCAAASIEDQAAIERSRQKILQFILMYRARGIP